MPTPVILQLADELLPVITSVINMSLDCGEFPEAWREALVLPSLKKHGLDIEFKTFCLVSNLTYISKITEKAVAVQLTEHVSVNGLYLKLQSAYKSTTVQSLHYSN